MSYTKNEERAFSHTPAELDKAVRAAVAGLEGKILSEDPEANKLDIQFPKTIHGKVLGDRTVFHVNLEEAGGQSKVVVEAYPVDAVGQKLKFGARKGITQTVLTWFWAHIEHNLEA